MLFKPRIGYVHKMQKQVCILKLFSVDLKAVIKSFGRSLMKPTVSVMIISLSFGNLSLLLAVSSVANIFFFYEHFTSGK